MMVAINHLSLLTYQYMHACWLWPVKGRTGPATWTAAQEGQPKHHAVAAVTMIGNPRHVRGCPRRDQKIPAEKLNNLNRPFQRLTSGFFNKKRTARWPVVSACIHSAAHRSKGASIGIIFNEPTVRISIDRRRIQNYSPDAIDRKKRKRRKKQPIIIWLDWNINAGITQLKTVKTDRLDRDLNHRQAPLNSSVFS